MKLLRISPLVLAICTSAPAEAIPRTFHGATPIEWSQRLASSEMARRGASLCKDGTPKARWEYTSGLFAYSLMELGRASGDDRFTAFAQSITGSFIPADGSIYSYREEEFNIDMVLPGRAVIACYKQTRDERFRAAATVLRGQLSKQPRTDDGGFWHKKKYFYQMWLDGLYMGSPFLAEYGAIFHEPAAFDEVVKQILLMDRHAYDAKAGLHCHGWDEKRAQTWSNPQSGRSPCFWGRSVGWYAMAIVDCLEHLPADHPGVGDVKEVLLKLAEGVRRYQNPVSGLWWQVLDQAGREGNYQEASASAMFVYAIAKAVNRGWLPSDPYLTCAVKGYEGMLRDFIREDDGKTSLTRVCEVAGLGFTNANGRPRDGSFDYYISEPVVENDLKGVSPFILAGIEIGRLIMTDNKIKIPVASPALAPLDAFAAPAAKITVDVAHPAHKIPPTLWGIFFEDINLSADGGIYPELVKNRSFEDADTLQSWKFTSADSKSTASIAVPDYQSKPVIEPLNPLNRKSLRINADGPFSLENDGYYGMGVGSGAAYILRLAARVTDDFKAPLTAKVVAADGKELASGELSDFTSKWAYYSVEITTHAADKKARLVLSGKGKGSLFLDMVSLVPKRTWKNHGLRPDLAESIAALKPAFLRFPGGCWVEGDTMDKMYDWKKTIGNIDTRTPLWNIWNYFATHGLGYHEYLVMAEDLGAEPLFAINCGMSHKEVIPMSQMGQWVQDALDAVEYANGPADSFWGSMRAKAGHPEPFNLKYLEIGNENGGEEYRERWALMQRAIKAKYPDIMLITNHWKGGYPKEPRADIVDEHFYNTPEWFMAHANHFDTYDRVKSPQIFVGEYAVTRNGGKGNLRAAIGEAAFMTGLERNSDLVVMASYAPLFVNLNHRAWPVNLINFDSTEWFGLPGYYVQKLFANNRGDVYLPTKVEAAQVGEAAPAGCIGIGTWNTQAEFKDIKVTAPDGNVLLDSNRKTGWQFLGNGEWTQDGGVLKQVREKEFIRALAGDRSWTDYTLELKARKLTGSEGFLVLFHINETDDRVWWNVGGWANTQSGVEMGRTLDPKKVTVETNRWYDLKVEVRGPSVKCWLDGKLTHDVKDSSQTTRGIYASSARDEKTGELILKIVNASHEPTVVTLGLIGAQKTGRNATGLILTSGNPKDENSIEDPQKVSPQPLTLNVTDGVIQHTFPGNSFTVLRVSAK